MSSGGKGDVQRRQRPDINRAYVNPGALDVILVGRAYCQVQIRLENRKHAPCENKHSGSVSDGHSATGTKEELTLLTAPGLSATTRGPSHRDLLGRIACLLHLERRITENARQF